MKRRYLLIPFLLLSGAVGCPAMEYHVSKTGNDYAPGTSSQPLLTVNAAAQRALPGDTVTVHSGVYREWVDPMYGGNAEDSRILYRAAEGETVELKGSEIVKGWKKSKQLGKDSMRKTRKNNTLSGVSATEVLSQSDYKLVTGMVSSSPPLRWRYYILLY